jgi:hypothetical protein
MAGEMADLTDGEQEIFNSEWDSFVALHYPERDFADVFEDNKSQILDACKIAKYQLECDFGGIHCRTNEFGWTDIQPNFVLASTTPTYSTSTWRKTYTTDDVLTMWASSTYWLGSSTTALTVSKYGTLILIGLYDPVEVPKISAVKAEIKGIEYPIWYVEKALKAGLHIYELPKPIVIEREQTYKMQAKVARAGDDELQLLGVYFGKGDHLRNKTAYAQV